MESKLWRVKCGFEKPAGRIKSRGESRSSQEGWVLLKVKKPNLKTTTQTKIMIKNLSFWISVQCFPQPLDLSWKTLHQVTVMVCSDPSFHQVSWGAESHLNLTHYLTVRRTTEQKWEETGFLFCFFKKWNNVQITEVQMGRDLWLPVTCN